MQTTQTIIDYGTKVRMELLTAVAGRTDIAASMEDLIMEDYFNMRIAQGKINKLHIAYPDVPIYDASHKGFITAIQMHNGTVKVSFHGNTDYLPTAKSLDINTKRCIINSYMRMNRLYMFPNDKATVEKSISELKESVEKLRKLIMKSSSCLYDLDIYDFHQDLNVTRIYLNVDMEIICHTSADTILTAYDLGKGTVDKIYMELNARING